MILIILWDQAKVQRINVNRWPFYIEMSLYSGLNKYPASKEEAGNNEKWWHESRLLIKHPVISRWIPPKIFSSERDRNGLNKYFILDRGTPLFLPRLPLLRHDFRSICQRRTKRPFGRHAISKNQFRWHRVHSSKMNKRTAREKIQRKEETPSRMIHR